MNNPYFISFIVIFVIFVIVIILISINKFNQKILNSISLKIKLFFYICLTLTLLQMVLILFLIYKNKLILFENFYVYVFIFFVLEWVLTFFLISINFKNLYNSITGIDKINSQNKEAKSLESLMVQAYSKNLYTAISHLKNKLKNYLAFVPKEYFSIISQNSLNKSEQLYKAILVCDLRSSFYYSETVSLSQNYEKLNNSVKTICNIIVNNNGIIDGFAGDGILSVFNSSKDALFAANQIVKDVKLKNKVGVALHYGKVLICEIGIKERKTITAISSEVNKTFKIEKINKKLHSSVVFTKPFLNNLPIAKYTYRYIGSFLIDDGIEKVALFESLETNNVRYIKVFEDAVRMFENGDFKGAKELFLAINKQKNNDFIVKFYLNEIKKID